MKFHRDHFLLDLIFDHCILSEGIFGDMKGATLVRTTPYLGQSFLSPCWLFNLVTLPSLAHMKYTYVVDHILSLLALSYFLLLGVVLPLCN